MDNFPLVEPILILCGPSVWHHPNIEEFATKLENQSEDGDEPYYTGNLIRVCFEHKNKYLHIVAYIDEKDFVGLADETKQISQNFLNVVCSGENTNDIVEMIKVCIFEDVWSPDGEQFCFSKFGKKLNSFPYDMIPTYISTDVCIHPTNLTRTEWGYST